MNTQSHIPPTPVLLEDLGMKFQTEISKRKYRIGLYKCHCGNEFKTQISHVKRGSTKSCGCYRKSKTTTHGMNYHPLNVVIKNMMQRCSNHNNNGFSHYGEIGITVYKEWADDRKSFFDWALANGYKDGLSIDRIDNNRGYSPENCRWTTKAVQSQNTRVIRSTNTSGYRGVNWNKANKRWTAQISVNRNLIYLGSFNTAIEAAKAYDNYVINNNLEHTINKV